MAITGTIKLTADQYLALGEDPPGVRLELVDGEIAVSPGQTPVHGYAVLQLATIVAEHVDTNGAGEVFLSTDVVFDVHEVRRPDLAFFIRSRLHLISEDKAFPVPPDFAVEVLSPSSVQMDRENKFDLYREKSVRFYWIVDPIQRTIEAYELVGRDYVARGRGRGNQSIALPPFPDLSIPLGKLWRPDYSAPRDQ